MESTLKTCTSCQQIKPLTDFHQCRKNRKADGHFNKCKQCRKEAFRFSPELLARYQKQVYSEVSKGLSPEEQYILSTLYPH